MIRRCLRRSDRLERRMIGEGLSPDTPQMSPRSGYAGRTIRSTYRNRLSILPTFPTTLHDQQHHLLLPNVPSEFIPFPIYLSIYLLFYFSID